MIFILAVGQKQRNAFQRDMNQLLGKPIQLLAIVVAGYVITLNWGTFIWAVTNGHVLQTSLGYYINPLVSILLALIFLKERFNKFEWLAILFAFIGVLYDAQDWRIPNRFYYISVILWYIRIIEKSSTY